MPDEKKRPRTNEAEVTLDRLAAFVYILVRDFVHPGDLNRVVEEFGEKLEFLASDPLLAVWSSDFARRIRSAEWKALVHRVRFGGARAHLETDGDLGPTLHVEVDEYHPQLNPEELAEVRVVGKKPGLIERSRRPLRIIPTDDGKWHIFVLDIRRDADGKVVDEEWVEVDLVDAEYEDGPPTGKPLDRDDEEEGDES